MSFPEIAHEAASRDSGIDLKAALKIMSGNDNLGRHDLGRLANALAEMM